MAEVNRIEKYAEWLVQNKDKQGTPEFSTVATAYKTMRSEATVPTQEVAPTPDINGPMQGFGAAFQSGIDAPLENMAETASAVGATGTAETLSKLTSTPEGYESASGKFIEGDEDGSFAYRYLPKAAVEQIGQYAGSLLTRAGGGAIGTAVGGPAVGVAGALAGPAAFEFVQQLGPIANERARNNGRDKPNKEDFMAAATTAAASGALNAMIPGRGGIVTKSAAEAVTEGTQSVVEQTGSTAGTDVGLQIDPRQAVGEGIIGGTSAGGLNAGISTVNKAGETVFRPKEEVEPETAQAAGDVARLLQDISSSEGISVKDVSPESTGGANRVLDAARKEIRKETDANYSVIKKKVLKEADADTKAQFKEILRQAGGKVSGFVSKKDFDYVSQKVGSSKEGQALLNSLRRANVLTELYAGGVKGGVSKFTDQFNPIPQFGRSYNPAGMIAGNLNAGAAVATGGSSLAAQIPLVVGGRAIDAVTGRRSKVNTFINQNKKNGGLSDPTGQSLQGQGSVSPDLKSRAKAAKELRDFENKQKAAFYAAEEAALNADQYRNGAPPLDKSPRGKVHLAIVETFGAQDRTPAELDAAIMETLDATLANANTTAQRRRAINKYKRMVSEGISIKDGKPLNDITSIFKEPQSTFESKPKSKKSKTTVSPEVQRGIDDNKAALETLRTAMMDDKSISTSDRAVLMTAMNDLGLNLGSKPVKKAKSIISKATDALSKDGLATKYLKPYLDRVRTQKLANKAKASKAVKSKS